jgi:hypothetical protein
VKLGPFIPVGFHDRFPIVEKRKKSFIIHCGNKKEVL